VVLDGVTVGVVSKMALTSEHVDVTARVAHGVSIPAESHAVLQQATVLGDIYVALERPPANDAPAQALTAGGVIPVAHTNFSSPAERHHCQPRAFVSSGSIQRATKYTGFGTGAVR